MSNTGNRENRNRIQKKKIVYDNGENYVLILIKSKYFLIDFLRLNILYIIFIIQTSQSMVVLFVIT